MFVRNCCAKCFCFAEYVASCAVETSWVQAGVYGQCPLVLLDFKQNWNESGNFNEYQKHQVP
jgi:hypothetical protein